MSKCSSAHKARCGLTGQVLSVVTSLPPPLSPPCSLNTGLVPRVPIVQRTDTCTHLVTLKIVYSLKEIRYFKNQLCVTKSWITIKVSLYFGLN